MERQAIENLVKVFDDKGIEVQANRDTGVTKLHANMSIGAQFCPRLWNGRV
jgi:hypothetical protein